MIRLSAGVTILAPPERCFDLARSVDLHAASAEAIHGAALAGRTSGLAGLHDQTTWVARFFALRFRLTTRITEFERPHGFSDVMCDGRFAYFGHRYTFETVAVGQTLMTDQFSFESPGGPLGTLFDRAVLRRRMRTVLDARALYIKRVAESDEWRRYLPGD